MPKDVQANLEFPAYGINVVTEFAAQPDQTCPIGINVRTRDPIEQRIRGGSRPGLVKYGLENLGGPVQNLIVVTTTDAAATSILNDPFYLGEEGPAVFDPSTNNEAGAGTVTFTPIYGPGGNTGGPTNNPIRTNPKPFDQAARNKGRKIRSGGSGVQPIREAPSQPDFIQGDLSPSSPNVYVTAGHPGYFPDNIPYVFFPVRVTLASGVQIVGAATGFGDTRDNIWRNATAILSVQIGTFGPEAALPLLNGPLFQFVQRIA